MSFWSNAVFYRPGPPPILTAGELAEFLERLDACSFLRADDSQARARINRGTRIDGRVRPFVRVTDASASPGVRLLSALGLKKPSGFGVEVQSDVPADIDLPGRGLARVAEALRRESGKPPARAEIGGDLSPEACAFLQSPASTENEQVFSPDCWDLTIGSIQIGDMGESEPPVQVSWIGFSFAGPGYFFPESLPEWLARVQDHPGVREITGACRATFPASGDRPSEQLIALRRDRPALWPVGDPEAPLDWAWGPADFS